MDDENLTFAELVQEWLGWISLGLAIYTLILLVSAILVARKAGYSHWLGVIAVMVPVIGPLLFLVFAALKWPALQERDRAVELLKKKGISLDELKAKPKAELDFGSRSGTLSKPDPKS